MQKISKYCFFVILSFFLVSCAAKEDLISKSDKPQVQSPKDIEKEEFNQAIHEKMSERESQFEQCFSRQISKDNDFPVRKVMSLFTLAEEGRLKASNIVSTHPLPDEFKKCFKRIIASIDFPKKNIEEPILIFYPLEYNKRKKKIRLGVKNY